MELGRVKDLHSVKKGYFLKRGMREMHIGEVTMDVGTYQVKGILNDVMRSVNVRKRDELGVPGYGQTT